MYPRIKEKKLSAQKDPRVLAITDVAKNVHRLIGPGRPDAYYKSTLRLEFDWRDITYRSDIGLRILSRGTILSNRHIVDFICYESIIVQLKAANRTSETEELKLIDYLKVTRLNTGILFDFDKDPLLSTCLVLKPRKHELPKRERIGYL